MGHIYYNDKRILVGETRKPKDNEFRQSISNVRIEWMDKDEFVDKNMSGIRITHD